MKKSSESFSSLHGFREMIGLSQMEFAEILGISQKVYSSYERKLSKYWPPTSVLLKLYEMGLNLNWLLSGEGPMLRGTGINPITCMPKVESSVYENLAKYPMIKQFILSIKMDELTEDEFEKFVKTNFGKQDYKIFFPPSKTST